jgi:hypothetical protein
LVNKYIVKNPSKRVPMVRHFKTTIVARLSRPKSMNF